jgi:hypothetical protein
MEPKGSLPCLQEPAKSEVLCKILQETDILQ